MILDIMPPMKNIYNLLSDAFTDLDNGENIEANYTITVTFSEDRLRFIDVLIKSKDPNVSGSATLLLNLDQTNRLLDYEEENDLFINTNWDTFCITFQEQIEEPPTLQQYLAQYATGEVGEDEFET